MISSRQHPKKGMKILPHGAVHIVDPRRPWFGYTGMGSARAAASMWRSAAEARGVSLRQTDHLPELLLFNGEDLMAQAELFVVVRGDNQHFSGALVALGHIVYEPPAGFVEVRSGFIQQ